MSAQTTAPARALDIDPVLRLHDQSVRSARRHVRETANDMRSGLNKIELGTDALSAALDAVLKHQLSGEAASTLTECTASLLTLATLLHTTATVARRTVAHGCNQRHFYKARLAEVRRMDVAGVPRDESTVNGDLAEEC